MVSILNKNMVSISNKNIFHGGKGYGVILRVCVQGVGAGLVGSATTYVESASRLFSVCENETVFFLLSLFFTMKAEFYIVLEIASCWLCCQIRNLLQI